MKTLLDLDVTCAAEIFKYLSTKSIVDLSLCSEAASRFTQPVLGERKRFKNWYLIGMHDGRGDNGYINLHPLELIVAIKQKPVMAQHVLELVTNPASIDLFKRPIPAATNGRMQTGELLQQWDGWLITEIQRFVEASILAEEMVSISELSCKTKDLDMILWLIALSMLPQLGRLHFEACQDFSTSLIEKIIRHQLKPPSTCNRSGTINFTTPAQLWISPRRDEDFFWPTDLATLLLLPSLTEVTCSYAYPEQSFEWPSWTHLCNFERDKNHIEVWSNVKTIRFLDSTLPDVYIAQMLRGMPKLTSLEWKTIDCDTVAVCQGSRQPDDPCGSVKAEEWKGCVERSFREETGRPLSCKLKFICDGKVVSTQEKKKAVEDRCHLFIYSKGLRTLHGAYFAE